MNTLIANRKLDVDARLGKIKAAEAELAHLAPQEHAHVWLLIQRRHGLRPTEFDDDFSLQAAKARQTVCYATMDDIGTIQELHEPDLLGLPIILYTWNPSYYASKVGDEVEVRPVQRLFH